jgi:hypothetical protein
MKKTPLSPTCFLAFFLALTISGFSAEKPEEKPAKESAPEEKKETPLTGHVFAWPFVDWKKMQPRGGTTQGSDVTLLKQPKESWTRLHEAGLTKFEQDRRAILAMAGSYRTSFDFVETLGFAEDYQPKRPYFSWGTEHVVVLEDRPEFISLQHTLVMYFKNEEGETKGPFVMKHWRQDWTYQDADLQIYQGDQTWAKSPAPSPKGRWSQAVFQVDDSPRYEVMGEWVHDGGMSLWHSDTCPRPLPRRESSVRKDYNILEGTHEITLTPNGWVHVQNNRKLEVAKDGSRKYIGQELGVNRYEEITAPNLADAFDEYWEKTGSYWKNVRETWAEVLQSNDRFTLKETDDDEKLFSVHFEWAEKLEKGEVKDLNENPVHARETIERFLNPDAPAEIPE